MAKEMVELKSSFGWIELQNFEAEPTDILSSRRGIAAVEDKLMFFDGTSWDEVSGNGGGSIPDNSIENKHIKTDAAIAASKLNLAGAIGNTDIADNADIELSKIGGVLAEEDNGRAAGVPYTFVVDVAGSTDGAADVQVFDGDDNKAPYSMIITDVSALVVNGGAEGTITLKNGGDNISNALAATTTNNVVRAETLDATKISIAKDATDLKLALNEKAFEAKVFISVLLVKEAA